MNELADVDMFDHHRGRAPLLRPGRRWRPGVFLAIDLVGFAVVNAFWLYVSTGEWVNFSPWAYHRDLTVPLGRVLIQPLSVFRYPWMLGASGLMLAVVIFVPTMVAVLYRLPFAGLFVVLVAVVGHAPLMAVALALGCFLAARTSWRSDMPFLAVLLGLLPAVVYLALGYLGVVYEGTLPLQRWLLVVPFLIALLAAVTAAAAVLALARAIRFRPGVVWPVLAALLAGPLVIFYTKIGPAELDYAILANWLAPGDSLLEQETLQDWARRNDVEHLNRQKQEEHLRKDLARRRQDVVSRCRAFLAKHAGSHRSPEVLWVAGQCQSLEIHEPALEQGLIRYVASHLSGTPECRETWRRLRQEYPQSQQAALADWRLGELALRDRAWSEAGERLAAAHASLAAIARRLGGPEQEDREPTSLLPPIRLPGEAYYRKALFEVDRLVWLMTENGDSLEALSAWLDLNPHKADYAQRLDVQAQRYKRTSLGDNLRLAVAMAIEDRYKRAAALIPMAGVQPLTDAAIEANYELGRLSMLTKDWPGLRLVVERPQWYFQQVLSARANPWKALAEESLAWLEATGRPGRRADSEESEYALLTGSIAGDEAIFEPVILEYWAQQNGVTHLSRQGVQARVRADLRRRRQELVRKCGAFLTGFPTSRRAPAVAWLAATCQSLQCRQSALQKGLIRYETSWVFDTPESHQAWEALGKDLPASPQSALAAWHLGELALRRKQFARARKLLDSSERRLASIVAAPDAEQAGLLLGDLPAKEHYRTALFAARRLIWLMAENPDALEPLAELLAVNPHELGYYDTLCFLARTYEQTSFADNLKLAVALATDDPYQRAGALIQLAGVQPPTDAAIEATYDLGRLAARTIEAPALPLVEGLHKSEWYFRQVQAARPNPWQPAAAEQLAALAATTRPSAEPGVGENEFAAILSAVESPQTIFRPVILDVWARSVGLEHLSRPAQRMRVRFELEQRRREISQKCEDFAFWYPHSLYAPKALWLAGQVQSLQIDEPALEVGLVRYGADHVRGNLPVRRAWQHLLEEYPDSRQAALARWHLGTLAARNGQMTEARDYLQAAATSLEAALRSMPAAEAENLGQGLLRGAHLPGVEAYRRALFLTNRLLWLMAENKVFDDADSAEALAAYLDVNPYALKQLEQLRTLAGKYEGTALGDNLKLAVALAGENEEQRMAALVLLSRDRPLSDAGIEACWELGWLAKRSSDQPGAAAAAELRDPAWYFRQIVEARPSPWQQLAAEQLQRLQAATQPKDGQ